MDSTPLRKIPLFSALPDEDLAALAELLEAREYPPHQPIMVLGDTGADLFVVRRGSVVVSYPDDAGTEVAIIEMGPGSFFGEISLLDGGPRTANIRAVTAVDTLTLPREAFLGFLLHRPAVARHLLTTLAARQRGLLEKLRGIRNVNEADASERDVAYRRLTAVAGVFASERFLLANLAVIVAWVATNVYLRASGRVPFDDPPTFFWLGFMISVEAILITTFVLNVQRHQAARDRIHADLEYHVNVKAHIEVMALHRKLDRLLEGAVAAGTFGEEEAHDGELGEGTVLG